MLISITTCFYLSLHFCAHPPLSISTSQSCSDGKQTLSFSLMSIYYTYQGVWKPVRGKGVGCWRELDVYPDMVFELGVFNVTSRNNVVSASDHRHSNVLTVCHLEG